VGHLAQKILPKNRLHVNVFAVSTIVSYNLSMLPLKDLNPTRSRPYVTWALIALNTIVFLFELLLDSSGQLNTFILDYGLVPAALTANPLSGEVATIFTAMFLHGSPTHLLGNMLYLWIFGDNIEDRMGHGRYLAFYLIGGVAAAAAQIVIDPGSPWPMVGASGAIAAVLGGYLLEYPNARVRSIVFLGYFIRFVNVPAILVLGFWFVLQFFNGFLSLSAAASGGGVAYFAHIGGFLAGVVLIKLFTSGRPKQMYWDGRQYRL
jgi:membrane associated rhomboid family serine protease